MNEKQRDERIPTGISNLDQILNGGLPKGSITILAGNPGSGKTILSQQIVFPHATPRHRVLIFQTLSEPTAKILKYLSRFSFFDTKRLDDGSIEFVDLGGILRSKGLEEATTLLMSHVKRVGPSFVIIDSFKVFEDLSHSREELRKFSYEVVVNLMAWEITALLLGEYSQHDVETNPLFSIADGIIRTSAREQSGEQQRFIQVAKMRGTDHSRDEHPFSINAAGLTIYAPRVTIRHNPASDAHAKDTGPSRIKTGIDSLDDLLGDGIPAGSSLLVSGVSGTGKTLISLEFIYRGAKEFGEKGIFISFEETEERLRAVAKGMGWDLSGEIDRGNIEIVFIPQTDILVEKDLLMMHERIDRLKAKRIAVDSISLFVHKIKDEQNAREKIFQLATLVQKAQAVGFFATDIPYGSRRISRFGVEETVVDGVILLTSTENGLERERYLEVYKLRNTAHESGRHPMTVDHGGITIHPRGKVTSSRTGKTFAGKPRATKKTGKRK